MSSLLNFYSSIPCAPLPRSGYSTFPDPRGPLGTPPPRSCLPPGGCYSDFNHHGLVFPVSEIPMDGILSHVFFAYDFLSSTLKFIRISHVTVICFFQLLYKNPLSDLLQVILLLVDMLVVFSLELLQIKLL